MKMISLYVNDSGYSLVVPKHNILYMQTKDSYFLGQRLLVRLINGQKFYCNNPIDEFFKEMEKE